MATFDYAEIAAIASELLTEFGQQVTITREGDGSYNPATGQTTPSAASATAMAAIFDIEQKFIDGTLVKAGDQQAYIEAGFKPAQGDTITSAAGVAYTVVQAKEIAPSGMAVLYDLVLRA